ncbi:MAG: hypothetical protein AABW63_00080 [Nanoarchaeota archaeon]
MRKRVLVLFLVFLALAVIFFNLKFSGFNIVNTTSNVTISSLNSAPTIDGLNSSLYVCEGNSLFYLFNASDVDGNPLTGTINPRDPFFILWFSQATPNVNTFAIISGIIHKAEVGGVNNGNKTYIENVSISDGYSSSCCTVSGLTNITTIEINNVPTMEDVGVKTVWTQGDNATFYKQWSVNDTEYGLGYGTLNYNISIKNSSGSNANLFGINSQGIMDFTGNSSTPVGVYNITLCVNDTALSNPFQNISQLCGVTGGANVKCDNFSLTVTDENRQPRFLSYYPNSSTATMPATNLYFNVTKYDPDGTIPDTYWYVDGVFVQLDSGSSSDEFSYSFGCGVSGTSNITAVITDGLLNASHSWIVTYTEISCSTPGGGGGGGGGGGANPLYQNFEIAPNFITTTVFQDEGKQFDIKINNNGGTSLLITSEIQNISNMAILNYENISVNKGESKTIQLYLYALSKTGPGVYYGKIVFRSGNLVKTLNIVLEVKSREALFDIKIRVPSEFKNVVAGDDVRAFINLLNVGLYGTPVDVDLVLYVTDFNKLVLYESSKEVIAVKTNLSVSRDLHVPLGTPAGTYIVLGEAKYGNITVSTYDTFNVVEKKYLRATFFLLIIGILLLVFLILFFLYKRRKKKEEEKNR